MYDTIHSIIFINSLVGIDASVAYIARAVAVDGTQANISVFSPIGTPGVPDLPPLAGHAN